MVVVAELDVRLLHLAAPLDVHLVGSVDQDIADRRILEQHFQRTEAEGLIQDFVDETLPLHAVEKRILGVAQAFDHQADLAAKRVPLKIADPGQVQLIDQLAVDQPLKVLEALVRRAVVGDALTLAGPMAAIAAEASDSFGQA